MRIISNVYLAGYIATLIYLTVGDWGKTEGVAWIVVIPANFFLSMIWPIYWAILHWIFV